MTIMDEIGRRARLAARHIANSPTNQKNKTLVLLADLLLDCSSEILIANETDVSL